MYNYIQRIKNVTGFEKRDLLHTCIQYSDFEEV